MEEVYSWLQDNKSWFEFNQDLTQAKVEGQVSIASREYGDVGDETAGKEDAKEAMKIIEKAQDTFPWCHVYGDVVDEWVYVTIELQ